MFSPCSPSAWAWCRLCAAQLAQVSSLSGTGLSGAALSGASSAISNDGNTAIVGAPGFNSSGGGVWTFTRTSNVWDASGTHLTAGTGATGAGQQGFAVGSRAMAETAIVGAPFDNSNAGAFWVYT